VSSYLMSAFVWRLCPSEPPSFTRPLSDQSGFFLPPLPEPFLLLNNPLIFSWTRIGIFPRESMFDGLLLRCFFYYELGLPLFHVPFSPAAFGLRTRIISFFSRDRSMKSSPVPLLLNLLGL